MNEELNNVLGDIVEFFNNDNLMVRVGDILEFITLNGMWIGLLVVFFNVIKKSNQGKSKVKASLAEVIKEPTKDNFFNLYHHIIDDEDMGKDIELDEIYTNDKDYNYNGSFESFTEEVNHIETHEIDYSEPMSQEIDEDELLSHEEWQQLSNHTPLRTKKFKKNNLRQMMLHREILSKPKGLE